MLSVDELVDRLIDLSFAEDIGDGDHTTLCCIPDDAKMQWARAIFSLRKTAYWQVWRLPRRCSVVSTPRCRWRC